MVEVIERSHCVDIAHAIVRAIDHYDEENQHPFVPGYEMEKLDLTELEEELMELRTHPRKYGKLNYFLQRLSDAYHI